MAQTTVKKSWGREGEEERYNPEVYTAINLGEKVLFFSLNA